MHIAYDADAVPMLEERLAEAESEGDEEKMLKIEDKLELVRKRRKLLPGKQLELAILSWFDMHGHVDVTAERVARLMWHHADDDAPLAAAHELEAEVLR